MGGLKVFIVEDNAIEMGGFMAMLEDMGHTVIGFENNGEAAVKRILGLEEKPDVILMDINLSKLDGIAAAKQLDGKCSAPVVFVTGYNTEFLSESGNNVYGFIQKPVEASELDISIRIAYNRAAESRRINSALLSKTQELEDRKVIERAKGIIMDIFHCGEQEAMKKLQKKSRDSNTKLVMVAQNIIDSYNKMNI